MAALLEAGLLQKAAGENDLGRKPIVLSVVEDAIHVMGLAVEAGFVSGVLVNLGARILERIDLPFPPAAEQDGVLETIFAVVAGLLSRVCRPGLNVAGIGVAMHGTVDSTSGISIFAPAIGWRNVAVAELLEERFGLPVRMENNAKAMVPGEAWFGNGQGVRHLLAVKVGQYRFWRDPQWRAVCEANFSAREISIPRSSPMACAASAAILAAWKRWPPSTPCLRN